MANPKLPRVLGDEEIAALFDAIPTRSFTARRNRAAYGLMLHCGLRVSEVCDLTLRRLRLGRDEVRVIGKGQKERVVPIPGDARVLLDRWLEVRPEGPGHFFMTHGGGRVSRSYLATALRRYAQKARDDADEALLGLERISPHILRHTFATRLLRRTGNLELVRKALGHASVSTTQIYSHLAVEDLREAMCAPDVDERSELIADVRAKLAELHRQQASLADMIRRLEAG